MLNRVLLELLRALEILLQNAKLFSVPPFFWGGGTDSKHLIIVIGLLGKLLSIDKTWMSNSIILNACIVSHVCQFEDRDIF